MITVNVLYPNKDGAQFEQPDLRQAKPASMKTRSSPSASASARTCMEPGVHIAWTLGAIFRPRRIAAAALRSLMRALVQEPMKAASI